MNWESVSLGASIALVFYVGFVVGYRQAVRRCGLTLDRVLRDLDPPHAA